MRVTGPVLALLAACIVLFAGSFTAARLARDDDRERVSPPAEAPPAALPDSELALGPSAPDLPGLRRESRPEPPTAAVAPSAPVAAAPVPVAPSEPPPQRVSDPSRKPRSEQGDSKQSPSNPSGPSQPSPSEPSPSQLPPEVEFYDSGG
jgi:hypothetical protein